jgi:hypothetical protein
VTTSSRLLNAPFLLAAALFATFVASLAGCGGADSKASRPLNVDACQLFTDEDAQAVAGETLAQMSSTLDEAKGRNPLECIYNSGSLDQPRILSLLIRQHGSAAAAKDLLESSRSTLSSMSAGNTRDVRGLGDAALWVGGRIQQLHVATGSLQLIITVQSPDGTDQLDRARQIAARVLERLKAMPKKR